MVEAIVVDAFYTIALHFDYFPTVVFKNSNLSSAFVSEKTELSPVP